MRIVQQKAFIARARRFIEKDINISFKKHHIGHKDYSMGGDLYAYTISLDNNAIVWQWNLEEFIEFCRSKGILRDDEVLRIAK